MLNVIGHMDRDLAILFGPPEVSGCRLRRQSSCGLPRCRGPWRSPLERLEPFQAQATTALGLGLAPSKRGFISANSSAAAARWQRSSAQRQCVAFKS